MQQKEDIYLAWAPTNSIWSRWAKPVLYAFMDLEPLKLSPPLSEEPWDLALDKGAAVVIDLPGLFGVRVALRLARCGYRPVPLFNAYPHVPTSRQGSSLLYPAGGVGSLVDMAPVVSGLYHGAHLLKNFQLNANAPPAFMMDSRRHGRGDSPVAGVFDNRSAVDQTDLPSGAFLIQKGITRAILVQEALRYDEDLLSVLLAWQESGIELYFRVSQVGSKPQRITIQPPSFFRRLWQRVKIALYARDQTGGFGRVVGSGG
jgi:hypothetical protein